MSVRLWVGLAVLAFAAGSLLRLGVETGGAGFTMFGMVAFLLIGVLALQEVAGQQARAGRGRLDGVLRRQARRWPVLRLPGTSWGGVVYLARPGPSWVALAVDTSSEAGLWALVGPALAARARKLREGAAALPVEGDGAAVLPVLVLVRRKVRARERALGEAAGVRLANPEDLPVLFAELAGETGASGASKAADEEAPPGPEGLAGVADRLGAVALR
ncbi:hypothetical protein [Limnochorda pilosa]|uniref:Uncharacterized protein n=1 Tax=Limnochorda pilosa TaxID=1555112 RepID=A0A0K2SK20_LIMPI|nr:hypothetical protein [Limnochorda pilosa]BAS27362.1 hypothetical protein LIP_1514 [Limnochorda pilosa]